MSTPHRSHFTYSSLSCRSSNVARMSVRVRPFVTSSCSRAATFSVLSSTAFCRVSFSLSSEATVPRSCRTSSCSVLLVIVKSAEMYQDIKNCCMKLLLVTLRGIKSHLMCIFPRTTVSTMTRERKKLKVSQCKIVKETLTDAFLQSCTWQVPPAQIQLIHPCAPLKYL